MGGEIRQSSGKRMTFLWTVCRVILTLGVIGGLLACAVFFVLGVFAVADRKLVALAVALSGGIVCLGCAWLLGRGVTSVKRRMTDLVIARTADAIRLNPQDHHGHCTRAFALAHRREYTEAIAHFDAAIRLDPAEPNSYVGRVNAFGALGQWDRVIAEYTEAIRLDPKHALAYCARATAYNGIGRFDRSISDATEAIRLAPQLYMGYDARGFGYFQRGGFSGLLKLIAIAWMLATFGFWRRDPFDWRTPTGSKADYEQAVADFTEAIRLNPAAWDCYAGRAQAYRALGENARAAADRASVVKALGR
jgi:tetratricopeptide (TPR) repeat protein